jgi:hypothetical protein
MELPRHRDACQSLHWGARNGACLTAPSLAKASCRWWAHLSCCRHCEVARANAFSEIPGVRQHDDGVDAGLPRRDELWRIEVGGRVSGE